MTNKIIYLPSGDITGIPPYGALPSERQYKYLKEGLAAFLHFGMNTMTGVGWGSGRETVSDFTLTEKIDADGYVKTMKRAGFRRIVLTVKHHDGFCLWNTKYTPHCIRNTNYPGDPVMEFAIACRDNDMPLGIYLSPWDRWQALNGCYGYKDADGNVCERENTAFKYIWGDESKGEFFTDYNDYFIAQIRELCEIYGAVTSFVEFWFDGAKGAYDDGTCIPQHYETALWDRVVREYFPECIIQNGPGGPTTEMVTAGNESGRINDEHWSMGMTNGNEVYAGESVADGFNKALIGVKYGDRFLIHEADGMLTHEWFGGAGDRTPLKNIPKSLLFLRNMYLQSVGYGTVLILNVPMNEKGRLDVQIKERIDEFGENIRSSYLENNLLESVKHSIKADGNEIIIELGERILFDTVIIEEEIRLGQRTLNFEIYQQNILGEWTPFYKGKTVGAKRIAQSHPIKSDRIKIVFQGMETPVISKIELHKSSSDFEFSCGAPMQMNEIETSSSVFTKNEAEIISDKNAIGLSYLKLEEGKSTEIRFEGRKAVLIGQLEAVSEIAVSIDDGDEIIAENTSGAYTVRLCRLFESDTLSDGWHIMKITAKKGVSNINALWYGDECDFTEKEEEWRPLFEGNGIFDFPDSIMISERIGCRSERLKAKVKARAVMFTIEATRNICMLNHPRIQEIEIMNGEENLALHARVSAVSGTARERGNVARINDGDINGEYWAALFATDYPHWIKLEWDDEVEFDTIKIYEVFETEKDLVGAFSITALMKNEKSIKEIRNERVE